MLELKSLAETEAFGLRLAARLFPGAVVALVGPLGAGKTTLTQAVAAGLGANPADVASPTFALIHEYHGRVPVYHFDTYRLANLAAFLDLGAAEYLSGDGVCLVEWADRVEAALPTDHLRLTIEPLGETARRVTLESCGPRHDTIVRDLRRCKPV